MQPNIIICLIVLLRVLCVKYWNISEYCYLPNSISYGTECFLGVRWMISVWATIRGISKSRVRYSGWYTNANVAWSSDIVSIINA